MKQVIDSAAYRDGKRVADIDIEHCADLVVHEGDLVWIGLHEPSEALLRKVQRQFGLHDLAIEDAHLAHQRPKVELYGESLFVVLRTAQLEGSHVIFGETHVFVGEGYIITVRHGPSTPYVEVRSRCESAPALLRKGEDFVLYALMDFVVDNYFPIIDAFEAQAERIEEEVFNGIPERALVERIYELRHEALTLRRAVGPLLDMCTRIVRLELPIIDRDMHPYFRDVHDHAIRLNERIEALREMLGSALEANLLLTSIRQGEVMRRLAGWAAILAVPTALAGVYGMNFEHMPELRWQYGYYAVVAAIAGICGLLWWRFRRAGWL